MNLWPEASDRLVDQLEEQLKPKRFLHVLGVLHTALGLAASHGVPPEPVAWAALLHDMCKSVNKRELLRMIERDGARSTGSLMTAMILMTNYSACNMVSS